ncbi:carnitine dehydratase [Paraburkholderia panacisoli]|uniref:Carnitine dehydratase n=2 Tax=Paraburkholderia panacisoli TaxID=2603818 RepID=A0A5B0G667_9BURK|nr:carnitine dehydratase [Paraburkholderia panacisoli]
MAESATEIPAQATHGSSHHQSSDLDGRLRHVLVNPITDDQTIDPHNELSSVLGLAGLDANSAGGSIEFVGRDPIVSSPLALATMSSVSLMAKAVSAADIWRFRGGKGQDLKVDLGQALHRLCPFYDKKWELLNGFPPAHPADPGMPFWPNRMYPTRDGRWIQLHNYYPRLRTAALAFLGCHDSVSAISAVTRKWDSFELEEAANRAGLQATVVRNTAEFLELEQYTYLKNEPLFSIDKIGDSAPERFTDNPTAPLSGARALGLGHVIAGAGIGRALAAHGADVLNIWRPCEYELDMLYLSSNVGMRSSLIEYGGPDGLEKLKALAADADVFFANRRPGYLDNFGLSAEELAERRPGMIHVEVSVYGAKGPWANRIGFDQTAGGATGFFVHEGSMSSPKLPEIFVVNDYVTSWISSVAVMAALKRRAIEGGSYRIRVSLTRLALWGIQMGIFDKGYARAVAKTPGLHEYRSPETFQVDTPLGHYQGVTDQVSMSGTPEFYNTPLVARGSSRAEWLAR